LLTPVVLLLELVLLDLCAHAAVKDNNALLEEPAQVAPQGVHV
jgi:hypothetical protein